MALAGIYICRHHIAGAIVIGILLTNFLNYFQFLWLVPGITIKQLGAQASHFSSPNLGADVRERRVRLC